jgi:hypothetical protein
MGGKNPYKSTAIFEDDHEKKEEIGELNKV